MDNFYLLVIAVLFILLVGLLMIYFTNVAELIRMGVVGTSCRVGIARILSMVSMPAMTLPNTA